MMAALSDILLMLEMVKRGRTANLRELDIPERNMLWSNDPHGWGMPQTGMPNVYRGRLQPPNALPLMSPSVYPDWKTKI